MRELDAKLAARLSENDVKYIIGLFKWEGENEQET